MWVGYAQRGHWQKNNESLFSMKLSAKVPKKKAESPQTLSNLFDSMVKFEEPYANSNPEDAAINARFDIRQVRKHDLLLLST